LQRYVRVLLNILERHIKETVKTIAFNLSHPLLRQQQDKSRCNVVQIDRDACIHFFHAQVAKQLCFASHSHGQQPVNPAAGRILEREKLLEALNMLENLIQQQSVDGIPCDIRMDRLAEADIHIRSLEYQIALDKQLCLGLFTDLAAK
jgi:hypothetical protein